MTRPDRIELTYQITFETLFHLGTGISTGLLDRTVIRNAEGYLYVPASTFKGVLREHCEQLCHFYLSEEQNKAVTSPHDTYTALADFGRALTPISRIFGSQLYPGKLHFNNAEQTEDDTLIYDSTDSAELPRNGKYKSVQTSALTQVRIDRLTGTAASGALYTSEFGTRNLCFKGKINGWLECTPAEALAARVSPTINPSEIPTYSLLLLLAGFQLIEQLGGNKSTGKGRCTCTITELKINKQAYSKEQWSSWLEYLDVLSAYA